MFMFHLGKFLMLKFIFGHGILFFANKIVEEKNEKKKKKLYSKWFCWF